MRKKPNLVSGRDSSIEKNIREIENRSKEIKDAQYLRGVFAGNDLMIESMRDDKETVKNQFRENGSSTEIPVKEKPVGML